MGKNVVSSLIGAIAIGASVFTGGTSFWLGGLYFNGIAAAGLAAGSSFALSTLQSALAPKSKLNYSTALSGGTTQQVKQALTTHKLIYGEMRVSGPMTYLGATNGNKYLHLIVVLAAHEVQEIGEVWLNDTSIPVDAVNVLTNMVTTGDYANKVRIKKHLGSPNQTADADLLAAFPGLTSNFRLRGRAYIYIRYEYDSSVFPNGLPNLSAWVKGRKLYDPRTGNTAWSNNAALCNRDYMTDSVYGFDSDSVDDDVLSASANTSDEIVATQQVTTAVSSAAAATDVLTLNGTLLGYFTGDQVNLTTTGTLPAGLSTGTDYYVIVYQRKGTPRLKLAASLADARAGIAIDFTDAGTGTHSVVKVGEPRYCCDGLLDTAATLGTNIGQLLTSMGGDPVYDGFSWKLFAAAYRTPVYALNEKNARDTITVQTKVAQADRFNIVKGVYASPINNDQPADYPAYSNSTYIAEDGGYKNPADYDLPYTQRPAACQRLAKIKLERARQELVVTYPCSMSAYQITAGDTIFVSNTVLGWTNKIFDVRKVTPWNDQNGFPVGYDLQLQETASGVYDWSAGEETSVDLAPNSDLPSVSTVSAPTGLRFDSFPVTTADGDYIFRIILTWDAHPDTFVLQGGDFEIQYKLSTETDYKPSFTVAGDQTQSEIVQGSIGVQYDIRIRAVNNIGVKSAWASINGVIAGSSGGVTDSENWGAFVGDAVADTEDWGAFVGDDPTDTQDWGSFL